MNKLWVWKEVLGDSWRAEFPAQDLQRTIAQGGQWEGVLESLLSSLGNGGKTLLFWPSHLVLQKPGAQNQVFNQLLEIWS